MVNKLKILVLTFIVGIFTALIYYLFEEAVGLSIKFVWETLFDTNEKRLLIFPVCIVVTLLFFASKHYLDKEHENEESHSLGDGKMKISISNILSILFIGLLSLLAGASLGPEAILVPACMIAGLYVADKLIKDDDKPSKLLAGAGLIALFAAFFSSFIVGFLSLFLVIKKSKIKFTPFLGIVALVASAASVLTLKFFFPEKIFFKWPGYIWTIKLSDLPIMLGLFLLGFVITWSIFYSHKFFEKLNHFVATKTWWIKALAAGIGLSLIFLLGGPLVQFTGNEAIADVFTQASTLGVMGLLSLFIFKVLAISWSKSFWYRGGTIFPVIFVASTLIAIIGEYTGQVNFMVWLIAAVAGVLVADRKAEIIL